MSNYFGADGIFIKMASYFFSFLFICVGRYIENHGVIHNIWFNTTTQEKKQYYRAQFVDDYWDNGSLPIWITAQRQVKNQEIEHFEKIHLMFLL